MEKLTFTSAVLESFGRSAKGGKASFSCSLTAPVIRAMGWGEVPEYLTGGSLDGDLTANTITITPSQKELVRHAFDLDANRVTKFESVRLELEGKKGKGYRTELRFTIHSSDIKGCTRLEAYMMTIGKGKSAVAVSYDKPAIQEPLPGAEASDQMEMATEA